MRKLTVHDQSWAIDRDDNTTECTNPFDASDPVTAASVSYSYAS